MYAFVAHLKARPEAAEQVAAALTALVEPSRAEPGCLVYLPHTVADAEGEFLVYERYVDESAFEAHRASEHYVLWVEGTIAPNLIERERVVATPLEP